MGVRDVEGISDLSFRMGFRVLGYGLRVREI